MSDTDDLERMLRDQLEEIHRRARAEAEPIVNRLREIKAAKPARPITVYAELLPKLVDIQLLEDMAAGMSIHRHNADGTLERIAPENVFATKPEDE